MDTKVSGIGVEAVEYAQESGTVRTQFDQEKTPASMAVIATLADLLGTDPVELDPLYSTVDPDELDALVRVRNGTNGDSHVAFMHEGHAITVHSYGVITITPEHELTAEKHERGAGR
ncbi:HalOD1 output domain-containing protein [Natronorubrum halophilum]|uniref:HalOD1 output domain-containing protein n=1 Tax=Natronorubrum halophilum TaxID=1702106 RepID=UPI0010C23911|nr:HalOD1 output domain-containing protein [Natronorubrum halophilum]